MARNAEQVAPSDSKSKTTNELIAAKMNHLSTLHKGGHAPHSPGVVVLLIGQALRSRRLRAEDQVKRMPSEEGLERKIQRLREQLRDFEAGIIRDQQAHTLRGCLPCETSLAETAYDAHREGLHADIGNLRKEAEALQETKQRTHDLNWANIALEVINQGLHCALENQLHAMLQDGSARVPIVQRTIKDEKGRVTKSWKEPVHGILAIARLDHAPWVSHHPKGNMEPFWLAAKFAKLAKVDKQRLNTLGLRMPDLSMVEPALKLAKNARTLFPRIDRLLQPGGMKDEQWNLSGVPARLSGFARSAKAAHRVRCEHLESILQMTPTPAQVRDLRLRDQVVQGAIRYERREILVREESEHRETEAFKKQGEEQRNANQENQGDLHGRRDVKSAPAERYLVYHIRPGFQDGQEVATGRLEREDLERGDHAGKISRSAFGQRVLAIHDLDPTRSVIPLQVRLARENDADTVVATVQKHIVELSEAVRKIIAYGPSDWGDQIGKGDLKNGPLPKALEPLFPCIDAHAKHMVVQIWGPRWSIGTRPTRITVQNPATHGGLAHLRVMVKGRPPKDQDWITADIDGKPIDVTKAVSPELLGELLDRSDETREGLAAALQQICRRHAKGKRAVLFELRGQARVTSGGRARWTSTRRKLALFDPVPINVTALNPDQEEIQKQLPRIIPFQGSGVSIQGTIDATKAFWAGQDNKVWPIYTEFQEFHIDEVETQYDAIRNVLRYMYPNAWNAVLRHVRAKDTMNQLLDFVPPADWHTFEHNVHQLWDFVTCEPMDQPLPTDLRRPYRVQPFAEDCMIELENPTASVVAL